ncbi:MAG: hypothetical protein HZA52_04540 [Planctomycetes bacterium]|nr:hypothetical protein [Planctomycetota bacterium]
MSNEVLKCPHCSALRADSNAATCSYCGATFAGRALAPPPAPVTTRERLAWLEAQPEVRAYLERPVPRPDESGLPVRGLLLGVGVLALLGIVLSGSASRGDHGVPVLPICLGVVLVIAFARSRKRRRERRETPPKRRCAAIVGKRTEQTGGEPTRTSYFLTLEFASGRRHEYGLEGKAYALCAEDDLGVADTVGGRGDWLTNFRRFPGA